jgi:hypothetical protein
MNTFSSLDTIFALQCIWLPSFDLIVNYSLFQVAPAAVPLAPLRVGTVAMRLRPGRAAAPVPPPQPTPSRKSLASAVKEPLAAKLEMTT